MFGTVFFLEWNRIFAKNKRRGTMKKTLFIFLFPLASFFEAQAQCADCTGTGRYADSVFTCATVTPNIQYGTGLRDWSWTQLLCLNLQLPPYQTQLPLLADFYEPCGDTATCRPLVIAIHGGAWAGGSKSELAAFCDFLAKKGYAVASINYRLSLPSNILCWDVDADSIRLVRAAFRAVQDAKAAVRFFRAHAAEYRIDTSNIFAAGASAGAFTTLGVGYMDSEDERPGACAAQPQLGEWFGSLYFPDMGSIEGFGGNPGFSSKVRGVLNMSGALFDLTLMDSSDDPPLVSFHGTADDVVPFGDDCLLRGVINANIFHHCIPVHGSVTVHQRADTLGMDAQLFTFPDGGHGYTPAETAVILNESTNFLCKNLKKTSGLGEPEMASPIRVYPNPAADMIFLETLANSGVWRLFDMQGRTVQTVDIQKETTVVQRKSLPAGIYVWHWQGGKSAASGRLILE